MERGDFLGVAVAGRRQHDRPAEDVLGAPAFAAVVQLIQSADEKRGAGEQDHGERELSDDQNVAKTPVTATSNHAARAALERFVDIQAQCEERGREAEREGSDERRTQGPGEHMPVEREDERLAIVAGTFERKPVGYPARDQDGAGAATQREQE